MDVIQRSSEGYTHGRGSCDIRRSAFYLVDSTMDGPRVPFPQNKFLPDHYFCRLQHMSSA